MTGEFTDSCKRYYELWLQWNELEKRFDDLLAAALPYTGQTDTAELDAIIRCNRRIQKARAKADECGDALLKATETVASIFTYFEIPPQTIINCEVPGFYELKLWQDDDNTLNCIKTLDLAPLEEDGTIITIHFSDQKRYDDDDEDEEDDF